MLPQVYSMVLTLWTWATVCVGVSGAGVAAGSAAIASSDSKPEGFPDALTMENFKTRLEHGLHLVEFFSPYCSHCKHLAPTWEKTWLEFHEEGESLGIQMVQVDCVASGDLCNQEKITAYPSLKLYGPKGYIKDYPRSYKRNQESLEKFMRNVAIDLADPNFLVQSKSKLITTDQMIKILGQEQKTAKLISMWPSTSLEDINEYNKDKFPSAKDADDCLDFQRTWAIVSNQLQSLKIETGHFNCLSNKQICEKLQLNMKKPQVILVLPNTNVAKVIQFDQTIYSPTHAEITQFAQRITKSAQVPSINAYDLIKNSLATAHIPDVGGLIDSSDVSFIYVYDQETTTTEDFELLPYLIEPLSKLPGANLYKSNDTNVLSIADIQRENVYKVIKHSEYDPNSPTFNPQRLTLETMTTLPALVAYREHSLISHVFQSFAPNEIRDQYTIIDWMNSVAAAPGFMEIKPVNIKRFMKAGDPSKKLAVLLLNQSSSDEDALISTQDYFLFGVHEYVERRDERRYQDLLKKRQLKEEEVQALKSKNAESKLIVKAMSKEIKHTDYKDVIYGYLDISKNLALLQNLGVDMTTKEFQTGDVLVFNRDNKYYYAQDLEGNQLNVAKESSAFVKLLLTLNGVQSGKIIKRLRHSPFPSSLRFMEPLHNQGTLGYLLILVFIVLLSKKGPSLVRKQKPVRDGLGILGNPAASTTTKFD